MTSIPSETLQYLEALNIRPTRTMTRRYHLEKSASCSVPSANRLVRPLSVKTSKKRFSNTALLSVAMKTDLLSRHKIKQRHLRDNDPNLGSPSTTSLKCIIKHFLSHSSLQLPPTSTTTNSKNYNWIKDICSPTAYHFLQDLISPNVLSMMDSYKSIIITLSEARFDHDFRLFTTVSESDLASFVHWYSLAQEIKPTTFTPYSLVFVSDSVINSPLLQSVVSLYGIVDESKLYTAIYHPFFCLLHYLSTSFVFHYMSQSSSSLCRFSNLIIDVFDSFVSTCSSSNITAVSIIVLRLSVIFSASSLISNSLYTASQFADAVDEFLLIVFDRSGLFRQPSLNVPFPNSQSDATAADLYFKRVKHLSTRGRFGSAHSINALPQQVQLLKTELGSALAKCFFHTSTDTAFHFKSLSKVNAKGLKSY
ncbi:hypothetical protein GEMRC1_013537 [Eukaryota sp. GEM-RC1]